MQNPTKIKINGIIGDEFFLVTEKDRNPKLNSLPPTEKRCIILNRKDIPEIIKVLTEYANQN